MTDNEIIQKWKSGLSKNKLAEIYKRDYNQKLKIARSNIRHRHDGKFISYYESLYYIERVIYSYLKKIYNL